MHRKQRWDVVIERLPEKEKASIVVTTPRGTGDEGDAKVRAMSECFRLRGWRQCIALAAWLRDGSAD
jgi:hypothetical protein